MKFLLLAAFVAAVAARQLSGGGELDVVQPWPWQTGKLYRYEVESHTLAALQEGKTTGSTFKAQFIIRAKTPGRLQAKLENPQNAQIHHELKPGQWAPENLQYEAMKELEKPFEISIQGGRVQALSLPSEYSYHHENLLKGLIGALQVDLSTHRMQDSQNSYDKVARQGQFKKMETDVTGDCETLYTVSPVASEWRRELPKQVTQDVMKEDPIEITKSKSYGHCHHRVAYHFGVPVDAEWTGTAHNNKERQLIDRTTQSRILAGKQGPIYKAETTTTVTVHPHLYGSQKAKVHSYIKLTLVSYEQDNEAEWQKAEQQREVENLLYTVSQKQVTNDQSSSFSESIEENYKEDNMELNRQRRSVKMPSKIVTINKVYINKRSDHVDSSSESDSKDSTSAYVNDDIPDSNEHIYAVLYTKQSPADAQKLVQDMAHLLQNPNNMPKSDFLGKYNVLVRVLGAMTNEQLSVISRSIESARSSNNAVKVDMWMIYRDALAQTGTPAAFRQIQSWILKKKIQGAEAAEVVASMVSALRFPTKTRMLELFHLAMNPEVREQHHLNSTLLIAATKLINKAQVNNKTAHSFYPTHMYGRLVRRDDDFVLEEIMPRLSQELEQAIKQGDSHKSQVFIKAIGNLGHRSVLDVFKPYLEGKISTTQYLRVQLVKNLRTLALENDRYVRAVLYSILRNTAEQTDVRVAAIQMIFEANPTSAMVQAMAHMTNIDPSIQVRAVLKSAILSAAELKAPRNWNVARSAQSAKWLVNKKNYGIQYSSIHAKDIMDSDNEPTIMSVLSYIGSEDSLLPKHLNFIMRTKSGDDEVSISASSIEQLLDYYKQQKQERYQDNKVNQLADKITEQLKIKRESKDPLEAALYFNLMRQQRYITFNEDDLKNLPKTVAQVLQQLPKGIEKHYTRVLNQAEVNIGFPLSSGMPFVFRYTEPTVVHIQGKIVGQIKPPTLAQSNYGGSVDTELQFTYARQLDGDVGFMDILRNEMASVGIVNKLLLNIPIKLNMQMNDGQMSLKMEPLRPDQDTTLLHYSVWPYSANQKLNSLTPVSLDSKTKPIERDYRHHSIDTKFGQQIGNIFHFQGYSYSKDYANFMETLRSQDWLSKIVSVVYQKDLALTHYNFRYLAKQSQNKVATFTVVPDTYYNLKHDSKGPLVNEEISNFAPNSAERRQQIIKKVASGIDTAKVHILDLSASFEGPQKVDYVVTTAIADSPVDSKIQYVLFAGKNGAQGQNQINAVATVHRPVTVALNFLEALKSDQKMKFEADIKLGQAGEIHLEGLTERTQEYAEALKNHRLGKQCTEEMTKKNNYQLDCHKMIVLAHTPDHFKASVNYKDLSSATKYMVFKAYKYAESFVYLNSDVNPLKVTPDGKLEVEVKNNYLQRRSNLTLNSRYGEVKYRNVPIPAATPVVMSTYQPIKMYQRLFNRLTSHQYEPFCSVDGQKIRTFSNRTYQYPLTKSWHVVMQDMVPKADEFRDLREEKDKVAVLARRPQENQQEILISYTSETGKTVEIEIKKNQDQPTKPVINVKTESKKISEGELVIYWDDIAQQPLLQYYTQKDGVIMVNIRENRLRVMLDGQRLVVLASENRNNTRGICGFMNGEPRYDYLTPYGLVDRDDHYGASFALNDDVSDPETQKLQTEAQKLAYKPKTQFTVLHSDDEWQNDHDNWRKVYMSRGYSKARGECELKKQVQYYENHGVICISNVPLDSCQSHCKGEGFQPQQVQVVCKSKLDQEFQGLKKEIREGKNPQVSGVTQLARFNVPSACNV